MLENIDKTMKKIVTALMCALLFLASSRAQENGQKYHRSSLYSLLISHDGMKYYKDIEDVFNQYQPQVVVNLAAQAGVRYSIINPDAYVKCSPS